MAATGMVLVGQAAEATTTVTASWKPRETPLSTADGTGSIAQSGTKAKNRGFANSLEEVYSAYSQAS
jgi:hypothetical protein